MSFIQTPDASANEKVAKIYHDAGNPADARPIVLDRLKQLVVVGRESDVREKLAAGAAIVQLYTSLIYRGPSLGGQILRELAAETSL